MICNITKIRLRSYICASIDVFLPSISSLFANNKSEKKIVPRMGFELVCLHSAARRLTATLVSWLGSMASNSVVHLAAAARIEVNNIRVGLLWFFSVYNISRPN